MRSDTIRAAALAAAAISVCAAQARAQAGPQPEALPEIVVTAGREPQPIERTGSAISVVTSESIATTNPTSLVDALRTVPGLDITETGGPGATTSVRLRGANAGQTLVLVDGVRVNDPSSANSEFDFSLFAPGSIERIEVLRGPQSALYGSDAIGGVVNIITRRGEGPPRASARVEAGRYGTLATSGALSGSTGPWSYAFSGSAQEFSGFSRYGYRIERIERNRITPLENDGFQRYSGFGRVGYDPGEGVRFELSGLSTHIRADLDAAPTSAFPDTPSSTSRRFDQVQGRMLVDSAGGALTHDLRLFANRTDRTFDEFTYRLAGRTLTTTGSRTEFIGDRLGSEYQGTLRLNTFGTLVFGGRAETETAATFAATGASTATLSPLLGARRRTLEADQTTRSLFALWTLPLGERLTLSLGGRYDGVVDVDAFTTYRATMAYLIPETGTKLRASVGTGGKAPTLFQLYSPDNGNAGLVSEESLGVDGGIDQTFLDGRLAVSVTGFDNRFSNLINFDTLTSRYFNTARAASTGVETEARLVLVEDLAVLKSAYTYLNAKDVSTNLTLARRPEHLARVGLAITPDPRWLIEPRVTVVSERFSGNNETGRVAPYARLDVYAEHKVKERWAGVDLRVFARVDNVTDTAYQEVLNYGTTGRAFYAGFNGAW